MMKSKQLLVGATTETMIASLFKHYHYFVYITPKKLGGQPVDIICLNNNTNWLIDAKHVRAEECSFPFSRIEPNQIMSLQYATDWANIENTGFAIFFERDGTVYYLSYEKWLEMSKKGLKSVNLSELPTLEDVVNEKTI